MPKVHGSGAGSKRCEDIRFRTGHEPVFPQGVTGGLGIAQDRVENGSFTCPANPDLREAEVDAYTGVVQGIGQPTAENTPHGDSSQGLSGSGMEHAMPRADDVGSPPAVVNTVIDAVPRGRYTDLAYIDMSVTPSRVRAAMHG